MPEIRVRFLVKPSGIFPRLVQWWTGARQSHVEVQVPYGVGDPGEKVEPYWITYSADTKKGVIALFGTYSEEKWETLIVPVSSEDLAKVIDFFNGELGAPYDWYGLFLSQVLETGRESPDAWFCSEIIAAAFDHVGLLTVVKPCMVSPGGLYAMLKFAYPR